MKKAFVLIVSLVALVSCVKEIEFNGEQTDPKLVINSLIEPWKPVKAYVGKSRFFMDSQGDLDSQLPDNVEVLLYVNDTPIGAMTPFIDTIWSADSTWLEHAYKLKWAFIHPYCPVAGDVVRISASAPGFDAVEASTSPLPSRPICGISGRRVTYWEKYWYFNFGEYEQDSAWCISETVELTIDLVDPNPGQTDFFRIFVNPSGYSYGDEISHFSSTISYTDPIFNMASQFNYYDNNITFTDQLFDGGSYQLKLPLNVYLTITDYTDPAFYRERIFVEHLTKEFSNYLSTSNQGDGITQFFSEPVQTYSNVNGGYGIVGGCSVDTLWVELPLSE